MKWVLKIGGSLYKHAELANVLARAKHLSQACAECTVVPGGGPFADQVRAAYKKWHLDEQTSHQMAILGMRQYGRLLAGLSRLPVHYSDDRKSAPCEIWLPTDHPTPACLAKIPREQLDWDFTSDSISICLANHIGAEYLVLVKVISVEQAGSLASLVDKRFVGLMQDSAVKVICLSVEEWLRVASVTRQFPSCGGEMTSTDTLG